MHFNELRTKQIVDIIILGVISFRSLQFSVLIFLYVSAQTGSTLYSYTSIMNFDFFLEITYFNELIGVHNNTYLK